MSTQNPLIHLDAEFFYQFHSPAKKQEKKLSHACVAKYMHREIAVRTISQKLCSWNSEFLILNKMFSIYHTTIQHHKRT